MSNQLEKHQERENQEPQPTDREVYLSKLVDDFLQEIGEGLSPEKLGKIKAIQVVPCGVFEDRNIIGILEGHKQQNLDPSEKMLVIFVNGRESDTDTVSEYITQFQNENPNLNILALSHMWEQEGVFSMGMIRAVPTELVHQIWNRNKVGTNPIIVSNDADCHDLPSQ
jgi:hypothetical protein